MKLKTIISFIFFFFCYSILAQEKDLQFITPDTIPKNVIEYVRKKLNEMTDDKKGTKINASLRVSNNKIYKVEFLPHHIVKYFNAEKSVEINNPEFYNVLAQNIGTQNIPIGWFLDLVDFGLPFEQPYFDIYWVQLMHT